MSILSFFLKKYFIIKPRYHNFGGFYNSLFYGLYLAKKKKKTFLILIYPLDFFYNKNEFYGTELVLNILLKNSIKSFILSVLISIIYNFFFFLIKCLNKIFNINIVIENDKIFSWCQYNLKDLKEIVNDRRLDTKIYDKLASKIFKKKSLQDFSIVFCVKDDGFSAVKNISSNFNASIENYRSTLNAINQKKILVTRIGESRMKNFDYTNDLYEDITKKKKHFKLSNRSFLNANFYFGTGASTLALSRLYNKPSVTNNSVSFLRIGLFDKKSSIIFKKIFSIKEKRLLKFEEIYSRIELCYYIENQNINLQKIGYLLVENSADEIYNQFNDYYENKIFDKPILDSKLLLDFKQMRNYYIKKNLKEVDINNFECFICNDFYIPDFYLKDML